MALITINNQTELKALLGKEVAVSNWMTITQHQIDLFAEVTGDSQWIHVDPAKAMKESPIKTTIAHGFLTLSLLSKLLADSINISHAARSLNYGLNKVRFPDVVPVDSKIRARFTLNSIEETSDNGIQINWSVIVERENAIKPCLAAEWIIRIYEDA